MAKRKLDISYLVTPSAFHELQGKKARRENNSSEVEQGLRLLNSLSPSTGADGDHNNVTDAREGTRRDSDKSETRHKVQVAGGNHTKCKETALAETARASDVMADEDRPTRRDATEERATAKRDELAKAAGVTNKDQRPADDDETETECSGGDIDNSHDGATEKRPESANDGEDRPSAQVHDAVDEEQTTKAASISVSRSASPPSVSRPGTPPLAPTTDCRRAQIYFTARYPSKASTRRAYKCRIIRTKLASSTGVKNWQELKQLGTVEYAGERYELGDVVYIYTDEDVDSPARIRDIRDTGDKRGRKEICVSWLWSKEEADRDCKDTSLWPGGATHTDSNLLQIFPWDTLNGRPTKAEVRVSPRVVLDACSSNHALLNSNNSAVRWISHPQNTIQNDDTRSPRKIS
jgi:hypothetical protein